MTATGFVCRRRAKSEQNPAYRIASADFTHERKRVFVKPSIPTLRRDTKTALSLSKGGFGLRY